MRNRTIETCELLVQKRQTRAPSAMHFFLFLVVFTLFAVAFGSKRMSSNIIDDIRDEPNKRSTLASAEARTFVDDKVYLEIPLVEFFNIRPRKDFAGDFAFLYASNLYEGSQMDLATILLHKGDIIVHLQMLKDYHFNGWDNILVALVQNNNIGFHESPLSRAYYRIGDLGQQIFDFCISFVQSDTLMKEALFHKIYSQISSVEMKSLNFERYMSILYRWSRHFYGAKMMHYKSDAIFYDELKDGESFLLSSKALLQCLREPEIDYLLSKIRHVKFVDIIFNIIEMIINAYDPDNEYSMIAKMVFVDIVEKLESSHINEMDDEDFEKVTHINVEPRLKQAKDEYVDFLLNPVRGRDILRLAMSSRGYPFALKTIVSSLTKDSSDLLNYGGVEMARSYADIYTDRIPNFPFLFYEFSQFDPFYDDFVIFEIIYQKYKYHRFFEDYFSSDQKWHTAGCVEKLYRLAVQILIPAIAEQMQRADGLRRPIEVFFMENPISLQINRLMGACSIVERFDKERHYSALLFRKMAFYLPEAFSFLQNLFHFEFDAILETEGTRFIERALEVKSLDAALKAVRHSKATVATALLKIYDDIPEMEFYVPFMTFNGELVGATKATRRNGSLILNVPGLITHSSLPFFETILRQLYVGSSLEMILPKDEFWADGKINLWKIATIEAFKYASGTRGSI